MAASRRLAAAAAAGRAGAPAKTAVVPMMTSEDEEAKPLDLLRPFQLHVAAADGDAAAVLRVLQWQIAREEQLKAAYRKGKARAVEGTPNEQPQALEVNVFNLAGRAPLHYAAIRGHRAIAKLLLDAGAKVDLPDKQGDTALLMAAYHGHEALVRLLLDHQANLRYGDPFGWTALHNACSQGHVHVARLLVGRGADVNAAAQHGQTPLMLAAGRGHQAVVALLTEHGADPFARTDDGETAYDMAAFASHLSTCDDLVRIAEKASRLKDVACTVSVSVVLEHQQAGLFSTWARHSTLPFADANGRPKAKHEVHLPSADWFWVTDWTIDRNGGNVDADGWQYAGDIFAQKWAAAPSTFTYARRRKWVRICKRKINFATPTIARETRAATNEYVEKFYELAAVAQGLEARHQQREALDTYEKAISNMLAGMKSTPTPLAAAATASPGGEVAAALTAPPWVPWRQALAGTRMAVVNDRDQKLQLKAILEPCFEHAEQLAETLRRHEAGSSRSSPATTPRLATPVSVPSAAASEARSPVALVRLPSKPGAVTASDAAAADAGGSMPVAAQPDAANASGAAAQAAAPSFAPPLPDHKVAPAPVADAALDLAPEQVATTDPAPAPTVAAPVAATADLAPAPPAATPALAAALALAAEPTTAAPAGNAALELAAEPTTATPALNAALELAAEPIGTAPDVAPESAARAHAASLTQASEPLAVDPAWPRHRAEDAVAAPDRGAPVNAVRWSAPSQLAGSSDASMDSARGPRDPGVEADAVASSMEPVGVLADALLAGSASPPAEQDLRPLPLLLRQPASLPPAMSSTSAEPVTASVRAPPGGAPGSTPSRGPAETSGSEAATAPVRSTSSTSLGVGSPSSLVAASTPDMARVAAALQQEGLAGSADLGLAGSPSGASSNSFRARSVSATSSMMAALYVAGRVGGGRGGRRGRQRCARRAGCARLGGRAGGARMDRAGDPPVWARDEDVTECPRCHRGFGFLLRRHHCRYCGQIFCDRCSSRGWPLPTDIKRVCDGCFQLLATGRAAATEAVTVRAAMDLAASVPEVAPATAARPRDRRTQRQPARPADADLLDDLEGPRRSAAAGWRGGWAGQLTPDPVAVHSPAETESLAGPVGAVFPPGHGGGAANEALDRANSDDDLDDEDGDQDAAAADREGQLLECPKCGVSLRGLSPAQVEAHLHSCFSLDLSRSPRGDRYLVYKLQAEAALTGTVPKECPICFEEFLVNQEIATLNCLCQYHRPCIDDWLRRGKRGCPIHAMPL